MTIKKEKFEIGDLVSPIDCINDIGKCGASCHIEFCPPVGMVVGKEIIPSYLCDKEEKYYLMIKWYIVVKDCPFYKKGKINLFHPSNVKKFK